ncbi:MAG: UDP-N-acetylmuramate dehydrogenase [Psychrobium sp.]|nr:UDP-N-acetylmuramate dehydrogenase [Psychrobium sp.]
MPMPPSYSLSQLNTFALEVKAQQLIHIDELSQLTQLLPITEPMLVLGGGSNMLFTEDYQGLILHNRLLGIEITADDDFHYLSVAGGENWHDLVMHCAELGIGGLENLALIPGTVGAAPVQNIGAYGVELADVCQAVHAYCLSSGEFHHFDLAQCQFAYRDSLFKRQRDYFISRVLLKLPKNWQPQLSYGELKQWAAKLAYQPSPLDVAKQVISVRQDKLPDPKQIPNVGSFFKNPIVDKAQAQQLLQQYDDMPQYVTSQGVKLAAGWLIDKLGLKGFAIGGAAVHQRQALVLINANHACADDVVLLAQHVREQVAKHFGVNLEPEVNFINEQGYSNLHDALKSLNRGSNHV